MTTTLITASDLSSIAHRANTAHLSAREAAAQAVEHAMTAGRALIEAKRIVGHGGWLEWLHEHIRFSDRTARLYVQIAEVVPHLPENERQRVANLSLREAAKAVASTNTMSVMGSSASPEWYTPPHIFDMAVKVLGEIDLDPSWHPESPVQAQCAYTVNDDGLAKQWRGRVYLNPPYGRVIDAWVAKLIDEFDAGSVSEAIALVPARVDTEWFRRLDAYPRCFLYGRLKFANADNPAPFPSAVVYLGPNVRKFYQVFDPVGGIFVRLTAVAGGAP